MFNQTFEMGYKAGAIACVLLVAIMGLEIGLMILAVDAWNNACREY